ncbi:hypothetical protein JYT20_01670, partial [Rhodothermus sp. AH-315-K08]|nr:hypothetical protein [Rhodothermus sp. AH-315-K08]
YLLNTSALALSLMAVLAVSGSLSELIPGIILASTMVAAVYTYRQFAKKGLWVLYDNLGIDRAKLFILPVSMLIALGLALRSLL